MESAKDKISSEKETENVPKYSLEFIYSSLAKARQSGECEYSPKDGEGKESETKAAAKLSQPSDNTGKTGSLTGNKSFPVKSSEQFLAGRFSQALTLDKDKPTVEPEKRNRRERREALQQQTLKRALHDREKALASGVSAEELDRREAERSAKPNKQTKNVFTRMEHHEGPLSLLYRSVRDRLKVKVWTRSYKHVRGICTGYILAFDTHFNLAMADVDEVYKPNDSTKPKAKKKLRKKRKKGPYEHPAGSEEQASAMETEDRDAQPDVEPMLPTQQVDGAADSSDSDSATQVQSGTERESQDKSNSAKPANKGEGDEGGNGEEEGEGEEESQESDVDQAGNREDVDVSSNDDEGEGEDEEGNSEETSDDEGYQLLKAQLASLTSELHNLEDIKKATPVKISSAQVEQSHTLATSTLSPSDKNDNKAEPSRCEAKTSVAETTISESERGEQEEIIIDAEESDFEEETPLVQDTEKTQSRSLEPMETDSDPKLSPRISSIQTKRTLKDVRPNTSQRETVVIGRTQEGEIEGAKQDVDSECDQFEEEEVAGSRANLEEASTGRESGECSDDEPPKTTTESFEGGSSKISSKSPREKKSARSKTRTDRGSDACTVVPRGEEPKTCDTSPVDLRAKLKAKREAKTQAASKLKSTVKSQVVVSVRQNRPQSHERNVKGRLSDKSDSEFSEEDKYVRKDSGRLSSRSRHHEEIDTRRESRQLHERDRHQETDRLKEYRESERFVEQDRRKETDRHKQSERYTKDDREAGKLKESERHRESERYREEHPRGSDRHQEDERYKESRLRSRDSQREGERYREDDRIKELEKERERLEKDREKYREEEHYKETGRYRRDDRYRETERHRESERHRDSYEPKDTERPRDSERTRESDRYREVDRQNEADRQRAQDKESDRPRDSERYREEERKKEVDRQRAQDKHREVERRREQEKQREYERGREQEKPKEVERQREAERQRESERYREGDRQRESDGHRESQRYKYDARNREDARHKEVEHREDRTQETNVETNWREKAQGKPEKAVRSRKPETSKQTKLESKCDVKQEYTSTGDKKDRSKSSKEFAPKCKSESRPETKLLSPVRDSAQDDPPLRYSPSSLFTQSLGHSGKKGLNTDSQEFDATVHKGHKQSTRWDTPLKKGSNKARELRTRLGLPLKQAGKKGAKNVMKSREEAERKQQLECEAAFELIRGTPLGETGLYQRHIKQVMIRGDNVVMVALVQ